MSALKAVCPKCLEPIEGEDHSCFAGPQATSSIQRTDRGPVVIYDHPNLDIVEWELALIFKVGVPKRYGQPDAAGIVAFIKERCEIPELPERHPMVEEYYMLDVRKVDQPPPKTLNMLEVADPMCVCGDAFENHDGEGYCNSCEECRGYEAS